MTFNQQSYLLFFNIYFNREKLARLEVMVASWISSFLRKRLEWRRLVRIAFYVASSLVFAPAISVKAQTTVGTIPAGTSPGAVAVNTITNKIYVANQGGDTLTVIDGTAGTVDGTIPLTGGSGGTATAVAVDTKTNKIFVTSTSGLNGILDVIDGGSLSVGTSAVMGTSPGAIAVNPVTNKVYVACTGSNQVRVWDELSATQTTVTVGTAPESLAINTLTNKIYVANTFGFSVTVIDGATQATTPVTVGTQPQAIAVNPVTNTIYVANTGSQNITVIDGATNGTTTVATFNGINPTNISVDPVLNKICVVGSQNLSPFAPYALVMDGATNSFTGTSVGGSLRGIGLNTVTGKFYVTDNNNTLIIVDAATGASSSVSVGSTPFSVAVNPVTNKVYVADLSSNDVTVVDGAANSTTTVSVGTNPAAVVVNPVTNKIYVADEGGTDVTVIDGATNTTASVAVGNSPFGMAVNPVTNKIYVAVEGSNNVAVIDGATNTATTVTDANALAPRAVAVNPVTNKIYVANNSSNNVTVIDGATNSTTTVGVGTQPRAVAINPVTNKIYVANGSGLPLITVIDGATNTTTSVSDPNAAGAFSVAVNPITNQIYVVNNGTDNVTVIDGATNATTTISDSSFSGPYQVEVNATTNKVYITSTIGNVTVIDGSSNTVASVITDPLAMQPEGLAVNPSSNKIYVANLASSNVTVIDGVTNSFSTVPAGSFSQAVTVDPVTGKAYVVNFSALSNSVTVINEQTVQANPLVTTVTPLTGNMTASATPNFNFTVADSFAPNPTTPDNLLFQVDTWQGPWTSATNQGSGAFTGTTPALQPGFHILYAFATDGQETGMSGSNTGGTGTASLIGNISAYGFLVVPAPTGPVASLSTTSLTFAPQLVGTTSGVQTVTLSNTGTGPLIITSILASGEFGISNNLCLSPLAALGSCTFDVSFSPTTTGTRTGAITVTDNDNGIAGSTQTVTLSGTGVVPGVGLSPTSLTFVGQLVGTSSGTQPVTLTNTGNGPLTITSIGASSNYSQTHTCPISPSTLAASASCTITVTFSPTVTGALSGTISIVDNAPGGFHFVSLSGTSLSASVGGLSSPSLSFGSQNVGTVSAAQVVTLSNTGSGPMGNIVISATGDFAQTNTCLTTLAVGANCTISVTYTPFHLGAVIGQISIANDSAVSPLTVNLSGTGAAVPFAKGEVFLSLPDGTVQRRTPAGALIQIMDTGTGSYTYGMAFDKAGNLYVSDFGGSPLAGNVSKFDNTGVPLGFFGSGYGGSVEDLTFNSAGDLIAGSVDGDNTLRIFDSAGAPLAQYLVASEDRGIDWFDLASDQCTLYYTSEGFAIKRFNVCTGTQLTDFVNALPGSFAYALRFLPSGGLLVADNEAVERLDASGNIIQSYTAAGETEFFGLNLDPDGTSFWTGGFLSGDAFEFDIASGTLLRRFHVSSVPGGFGITVNGEITVAVAADLALAKIAAPSPVQINNNLTFTLTATNLGPSSAGNVTVTDTLPAGVALVTATPSAGSCTGATTVSCNVGTLASAGTATVTIVVNVTAPATVSNTATVSSDVSDPNPANNTATTNTTVSTGATITLSPTPTLYLPGTHINQTCTPGVVTVTNSGSGALTISGITISGPYTQTNSCPATLAAGASCAVNVTFVPTVVGAGQTGTLTIASNASTSPDTVGLSGDGLSACLLAPNSAAAAVLRGLNSTTFVIAHQACSAAGTVHLSCAKQGPASCSFSPEVLTSPNMPSTLTVSNLQALASDLKFEVHADAELEHLYTGLAVDLMDFQMASAAATGTVRAGQTASYALAVEPQHGLQGQVTFTCSGAPQGAACSVTPQSVTLKGTGVSSVEVKVSTTARSLAPGGGKILPPAGPIGLMLLALMGLLAGIATRPKARRRLASVAAALVVAMVLTWASCGGGSATGVSINSNATPSGTYTLTVTGAYTATGSTATITHDSSLTLTVN